jgi:hypothetical protein
MQDLVRERNEGEWQNAPGPKLHNLNVIRFKFMLVAAR